MRAHTGFGASCARRRRGSTDAHRRVHKPVDDAWHMIQRRGEQPLIDNGHYHLFRRRKRIARFRAAPGLAEAAVTEVIGYLPQGWPSVDTRAYATTGHQSTSSVRRPPACSRHLLRYQHDTRATIRRSATAAPGYRRRDPGNAHPDEIHNFACVNRRNVVHFLFTRVIACRASGDRRIRHPPEIFGLTGLGRAATFATASVTGEGA